MRCWNKTTCRGLLFSAIALLLTLGPGEVLAQSGEQTTGRSWAEIQQALHETLASGGGSDVWVLEEMKRFEDPGLTQVSLSRGMDALDRAFGYLYVSDLEARIHNLPHQGTDGISAEWFPRAGSTSRYRFHYATTLAVGVEEGPWGTAEVIESLGYYNGINDSDWEAKDGQRGEMFSNPPQLRFSYPLMAMTFMEATWPDSGWPAPEDVVDVWWGTDTWKKWERKAEAELYGEFDDSETGRDDAPPSESYPLGIEGKIRGLAYGAYDAAFWQFELTNVSGNEYTEVFIGYPHVRQSPWVNNSPRGWYRFDTSRNLLYGVGANYNPGAGTHEESDGDAASWGGLLFLESPTGSFKKDSGGTLVDNPDQVLTRLSLSDYSDRVLPQDHEWSYYAALSGDISYFDDPLLAVDLWKTNYPGQAGAPVLMQSEDHWNYQQYGTTTPSATDIDDGCGYGTHYPSSGPITWAPGESIDFVVATVAGYTEQDLLVNADKVIRSYQAQFAASGPPPAPRLHTDGVLAGPAGRDYDPNIHSYQIHYADSGPITLTWDGQEAEHYADPITGTLDFQGYRIYRSSDRGDTWGTIVTDEDGNVAAYQPVAQFDLDDGVTGRVGSGSYLNLGDDTGIVHSWTDQDALDGMEYWYSITAYDYDPAQDPLNPTFEASRGTNPNAPNVIAVVAGSRPNGYQPGQLGTGASAGADIVLSQPADPDKGTLISAQVVYDVDITGDAYELQVTDSFTLPTGTYSYWAGLMLRNTTTGTDLFEAPRMGTKPEYGMDNIPVVEGFQVMTVEPNEGNGGVYQLTQTAEADPDTSYSGTDFFTDPEAYMESAGPEANRANVNQVFSDFEMRFVDSWPYNAASTDTNWCVDVIMENVIPCPFELWDVDNNVRVYPVIYDYGLYTLYGYSGYGNYGEWDSIDITVCTSVPYWEDEGAGIVTDFTGTVHPWSDSEYWDYDTSNPNSRSDWVYRWGFGEEDRTYELWDPGDVWLLETYEPLAHHAGESFTFSTTAAAVADTAVSLDNVRVVPNPYYIFAEWDQNVNKRKIQFRNVPPNSTIDIYTLSGELIACLAHDDEYNSDRIGTVDWKIWTYEYTEAAYGLYIYVVKTADGQKKVGKFAIIR